MQFYLDTTQQAKLELWRQNHFHECKYYRNENGFEEIYVGAIGGHETFCFTPTGIGLVIKVQCACGEEVDLTDYEYW